MEHRGEYDPDIEQCSASRSMLSGYVQAMAHRMAELHRRIASAEHGVEQSLKHLASWITKRNPVDADAERTRQRVTEDAEKISERADEHLKAAERIEERADDK